MSGEAPAWFVDAIGREPDDGDIQVDGCRIAHATWQTVPDRPDRLAANRDATPVLALVHGGAAHTRWWSFTAPLLTRDADVIAMDLSGHGRSGHRVAYRMEQWADEVSATLDAVAPGRRVMLLGHSLGGMVAVTAASREPKRYERLIVADSNIRPPGMAEQRSRKSVFLFSRTYPNREMAVERFALVPRQPCLNTWALRHVAEHSVMAHGDTWGWRFDPQFAKWTADRPIGAYATELRVPVSVIRAEHSQIMPSIAVDSLRQMTGQPIPAVTVPGAHHHLMIDQPLAFVAAVRAVCFAH